MIVTEQIDEDSPLFKELEAEADKESARLACLLDYYSNDRIALSDEQENRIIALNEEWYEIYKKIRELYRIYGTNDNNFRSDFKTISEKAINDAEEFDFDEEADF